MEMSARKLHTHTKKKGGGGTGMNTSSFADGETEAGQQHSDLPSAPRLKSISSTHSLVTLSADHTALLSPLTPARKVIYFCQHTLGRGTFWWTPPRQ